MTRDTTNDNSTSLARHRTNHYLLGGGGVELRGCASLLIISVARARLFFRGVGFTMSIRTRKADLEAARAWEGFLAQNQEVIGTSGLPLSVFAGRQEFELFLMHSSIAGASYHLELSALSEQEREAIKELVVRYIATGFDDPGVSLFNPSEDHRLVAQGVARRRKIQGDLKAQASSSGHR